MAAHNKDLINESIGRLWRRGNRFLVIDDPKTKCRTSAAIRRWNPGAKITAISSDPELAKYRIPFERCGCEIEVGVSTEILESLGCPRDVDGVFLDYCATPARNNPIFDWVHDVELCFDNIMKSKRVVFVTFSKRNFPSIHTFVESIVRDELPDLTIVDSYEYTDTSPMVAYTFAKKKDWSTHRCPPGLAQTILPKPGDRIQVIRVAEGEHAWAGTFHRMVNSKEWEVKDLDDNIWLVHPNEIHKV